MLSKNDTKVTTINFLNFIRGPWLKIIAAEAAPEPIFFLNLGFNPIFTNKTLSKSKMMYLQNLCKIKLRIECYKKYPAFLLMHQALFDKKSIFWFFRKKFISGAFNNK
jgi:hypothetical protein